MKLRWYTQLTGPFFNYGIAQSELTSPPGDSISALQYAPSSTKLLVSSWDSHVYLYETQVEGETGGKLLKTIKHPAVVLDVTWGKDETEAFSAGLNWEVRRYVKSENTGEGNTDHLRNAD
jgi:hypothetical protein